MSRPQGNSGQDRLWERFELTVRDLVASLDPQSTVKHNQRVQGRYSCALRQLDVWVQGKVAGLDISVGVECKKHGRVIDVGTIDGFIGKLLDIGADRGIIYSYSGFSGSAVTRAIGARNPAVLAVTLETPLTMDRWAPGDPRDSEVVSARWAAEMDEDDYRAFLEGGEWSTWWS
ncbi:restriction endonuclease [Micromonospora sp. WMMD735]|uniref:restriction endonuclease n=1 Tax=Micromonospora sp. WMMD735 TaxID=3404130 RepID=UPI003B92DA7B